MLSIPELEKSISEEITSFSEQLDSSPKELYDPIKYILSLGGKRVRPLLVLLSNQLFSTKTADAIPAAIGLELFHNFSLIHDDLMDNAPFRRNKPTVHTKWNQNIAILSGDAMLVKAYQTLCKSNYSILNQILETFNKTALQVCEGQQLDMNYESISSISTNDYLRMITLKTAVLIAACSKIGALIGNANTSDTENMYSFGLNIGIAFQLQDDLLDVYGEQRVFGKQKAGDIIANKKTFLTTKAIELASQNQLEKISYWFSKKTTTEEETSKKIDDIINVYNELNIKNTTLQAIKKYHQKAIENIHSLSTNKANSSILISYINTLINRES